MNERPYVFISTKQLAKVFTEHKNSVYLSEVKRGNYVSVLFSDCWFLLCNNYLTEQHDLRLQEVNKGYTVAVFDTGFIMDFKHKFQGKIAD